MHRFALLALLLAVPLLGGPITYTLTGTASGTLQNSGITLATFPDGSAFVWTGVQYLSPAYGDVGFGNAQTVILAPVSITITPLGSGTPLEYTNWAAYLLDYPTTGPSGAGAGSLFVAPSSEGGILLSADPGAGTVGWDLNSALGPISVNNVAFDPSSGIVAEMSTHQGVLEFTSLSGLTFQAEGTGIPEPATWMLMGLGAAALALFRVKGIRGAQS